MSTSTDTNVTPISAATDGTGPTKLSKSRRARRKPGRPADTDHSEDTTPTGAPEDLRDIIETALDEAHAIADLIFTATTKDAVAGEYAGELWAKTLHVAAHAIAQRIEEAQEAAGHLAPQAAS